MSNRASAYKREGSAGLLRCGHLTCTNSAAVAFALLNAGRMPAPQCFAARRCSVLVVALLLTLGSAAPVLAQKAGLTRGGIKTSKEITLHPQVKLETSVGDITIELYQDKAPITVENFLTYVRDGFYDGLVFHRVMPDFMIQGGGHEADLSARTEGLHAPIKNESRNGLKNERGTIAMARLSDPDSATSQFFINVVDNARLDPNDRQPYGYTVFGRVIDGMRVVDRIRHSKCIQDPSDPRKGQDGAVNPDPPVVIKKATVVGEEPSKKEK